MLDSINQHRKDVHQGYKECAGKKCQNVGIHSLNIRYVYKRGWFCDSCKANLVTENLVEVIGSDDNNRNDCTDAFYKLD